MGTFAGIFGHPRRLVTEATQRLTTAAAASKAPDGGQPKFILMGSNGVANPNGMDEIRPRSERTIIFLLRYLIPPHADNEGAAAYLHNLREKQKKDGSEVTRANVAHFMVDLVTKDETWKKWEYQMPVLMNVEKTEDKDKSELKK